MAKIVRVHDPDETEKRCTFIAQESQCPGLLEFMSRLPYGTESPLLRGIVNEWFQAHEEAGDIDEAASALLGKSITTRRRGRPAKAVGAKRSPPSDTPAKPKQKPLSGASIMTTVPAVAVRSDPVVAVAVSPPTVAIQVAETNSIAKEVSKEELDLLTSIENMF